MAIQFCKLSDGSWGIQAPNVLQEGTEVTVVKRDGTTSRVKVGAVSHTNGKWTAALVKEAKPVQAAQVATKPRSTTSGGPRTCRARGCHALAKAGFGGYCAQCAHDEYDF